MQFFFRSHSEMRVAQKNHQSGNIDISWSEKAGNLYGRVSSTCHTYAYAFHEIAIQGELQIFQRMAVAPALPASIITFTEGEESTCIKSASRTKPFTSKCVSGFSVAANCGADAFRLTL